MTKIEINERLHNISIKNDNGLIATFTYSKLEKGRNATHFKVNTVSIRNEAIAEVGFEK